MKGVFRAKAMIALTVICCLLIGGTSAFAGTTTCQSSFPSNGNTVQYKTTGDDCSEIQPYSGYGVLGAVMCRTLCKLYSGDVVYSNPETVAFKGQSTYLGAYADLDLQSGQAVWLEQWTYSTGTADTTYTYWDFH